MLRVALCDDNALQLDLLLEYFEIYKNKKSIEIEIGSFVDGEKLLADVSANGNYDIYILDLIMPGMNGIELATVLRENNDMGKIVFLTSSMDFVFNAFSVKASNYLLKPVDPEKFFEQIDILRKEIRAEAPPTITVRTPKGDSIVKVFDITYIENVDRVPHYHLVDGKEVVGISIRQRFSEAMAELIDEYGFALCGAGILVNIEAVDSMKSEIIYLKNGEELICSRSQIHDFKTILLDYWGK